MNMTYLFAPGETKTFPVGGGRFYFEDGLGAIRVKTLGNDSVDYELKPGMGFQNRPEMQNFFGVEVKNIYGAEQEISFIVSYRELFDNRVSFGASVITTKPETVRVYNSRVLFAGVTGSTFEPILIDDNTRVSAVMKFVGACRIFSRGRGGGGATVTSFPVNDGDIIEWDSQDGLDAYETTAGGQVYIMEKSR